KLKPRAFGLLGGDSSDFPERGVREPTVTEGRSGAREAPQRLSHPEGLVGFRPLVTEELLRVLENARVPEQEVKAALVEVEEPVDQLSLGAVSNGEGFKQIEVKLFGGKGGQVKAAFAGQITCGGAYGSASCSVHRGLLFVYFNTGLFQYRFISIPAYFITG